MASEQDFEIFSGNDVVLDVTITDSDNDGAPVNLTGALDLVWAMAKKAKGTALVTKDLLDGVLVVSAIAGTTQVLLDSADLEPLSGEYYHEMRLTNADGKKITVMYGVVTIAANLIRS